MNEHDRWVRNIRDQIREVGITDIAERIDAIPHIIDVREFDEYGRGTIPGAVCLPVESLQTHVGEMIPDRGEEILVVCNVGNRSAIAAALLQQMGYTNVVSLRDGFEGWRLVDLPWDVPRVPVESRLARYGRHIMLPGVGESGQRKLLDAKVLIVGAGGLGSPVAIYLAAAGVGTLGLVDFDVVDVTNLQRQIIHTTDRIGEPKVESARDAIGALNPDVTVVTHRERLGADNVLEILAGYDVIVDGTDNFPTRYLLNDASLRLKIPVVHGAVFRFDGQVSVFFPYEGPCYRCVFAEPPPPELAPSCAEAGVFGVLPGVIGTIQATETIKVLLGIGTPLVGRLLIYDALEQEFRTLQVRRNPACPACADEASPPSIVEYDEHCTPAGVSGSSS